MHDLILQFLVIHRNIQIYGMQIIGMIGIKIDHVEYPDFFLLISIGTPVKNHMIILEGNK